MRKSHSIHRVWPAAAVAALLLCHCAGKRPAPLPETLDAGQAVERLRARGETIAALSARIEVEAEGMVPPAPKLYGAVEAGRQAGELCFRVQAYLPLGAPVLELNARGDDYQLLLPSQGRAYVNSLALLSGRVAVAAVSEEEAAAGFPVRLFADQLGLIFGMLPRPGADYRLLREPEQWILEEAVGGVVARRIFLDPRDLSFRRLEVGAAAVAVESGRFRRGKPFSWLPRKLVLQREGLTFKISLSQWEVNPPNPPEIVFRDPAGLGLYLVEPDLASGQGFSEPSAGEGHGEEADHGQGEHLGPEDVHADPLQENAPDDD